MCGGSHFNLHFPNDTWCGTSFRTLICHLYVSFGEMFIKVIGPFFNCVVSYCWVLRVLCNFWVFCKYFLPGCGLSFILLTVSFAEQFLILMKSSLSILSWIVPLVLYLKSHCQTQGHLNFLLSYCLEVVQFCITAGSVIHSKLIFVKGIRAVSRFIFWHVDVQWFQHHLLKRLSLVHCMPFFLF